MYLELPAVPKICRKVGSARMEVALVLDVGCSLMKVYLRDVADKLL